MPESFRQHNIQRPPVNATQPRVPEYQPSAKASRGPELVPTATETRVQGCDLQRVLDRKWHTSGHNIHGMAEVSTAAGSMFNVLRSIDWTCKLGPYDGAGQEPTRVRPSKGVAGPPSQPTTGARDAEQMTTIGTS